MTLEETSQIEAVEKSFISLISDYISEFQNWWWFLGCCLVFIFVVVYLLSNKKQINELSEKKLREFKQSKKYMPILFVELSNVKELLRYFVYGQKWKNRIISSINTLYRGKRLFKNYSKKYIKKYALSYFSTLRDIQNLINRHLEYFSSHEYLKENPSYFPDYKYTLEVNSYYYQEVLKEERKKCEIMDSHFILIKGTAGNGKTNLVCNVVELLLKLKKRVIFINARDVTISFHDYLISCLHLYSLLKKIGNIIYSLFFRFFETYIVVDAINENDTTDFAKQLFSELDKLANRKAKIIITCREEYFEQRFSNCITGISNKPYIIELNDYRVRLAKEKLLERYCKNYRVEKLLPFIADQLFSTSLLLVRLYFEVNEGKSNQDITLYRYKIYQKYIQTLERKYEKEDIENLIDSISRIMIDKQTYNFIPIREITDDVSKISIIRNISDDNLLTGRKIVRNENTIAETSEEVIYFPFDELRDYCLARCLVIQYFDTVKSENELIAKTKLYNFLSTLKRGYLSPLEGVLHYIYLHFKTENKNYICEELLNKGFYAELWNYGRDELFHNFALTVILDSEYDIADFELHYIASILLLENRDTVRLFLYFFYQEQKGMENRLQVLLKIIYSYSNFSDLEKILGCYNSHHFYYYTENKHIKKCLERLLYSLEENKCIDCIEYFAIIGLIIEDMYSLQNFVELCPNYIIVLHNIIQNTKCNALKQKAQNALGYDIQPYGKEKLIKELREVVAYYEES